jgi:hypothetical protein
LRKKQKEEMSMKRTRVPRTSGNNGNNGTNGTNGTNGKNGRTPKPQRNSGLGGLKGRKRRKQRRQSFIELESHRPDRLFDFTYTVTALSTILNILPYPIDVCVRTTPVKKRSGNVNHRNSWTAAFGKGGSNGGSKGGRKGGSKGGINVTSHQDNVYVAKAIGVGASQHVPNPIGPDVIESLTLSIRPSPLTFEQYYEQHYHNIRIPNVMVPHPSGDGTKIAKGYEKTIFEEFEEFTGWTPYKLYEAALEKARQKCDQRSSLDKWEEFATESVVKLLHDATKHHPDCHLHEDRHDEYKHRKHHHTCRCNVLQILHRGPLYGGGRGGGGTESGEHSILTLAEKKKNSRKGRRKSKMEQMTGKLEFTDAQQRDAIRYILEHPHLPIDHDLDAMHAAGLKAPRWSDPVVSGRNILFLVPPS